MAKAITDRIHLPGGVTMLVETEDGDDLLPGVQRLAVSFVYELQMRAYESAVAEAAAEAAAEQAKTDAKTRRQQLLSPAATG